MSDPISAEIRRALLAIAYPEPRSEEEAKHRAFEAGLIDEAELEGVATPGDFPAPAPDWSAAWGELHPERAAVAMLQVRQAELLRVGPPLSTLGRRAIFVGDPSLASVALARALRGQDAAALRAALEALELPPGLDRVRRSILAEGAEIERAAAAGDGPDVFPDVVRWGIRVRFHTRASGGHRVSWQRESGEPDAARCVAIYDGGVELWRSGPLDASGGYSPVLNLSRRFLIQFEVRGD